ncbi:6-phosphogluconolactonase [Planctomycetota bacterium]|nr:6-phosphogluconolactonase [Planctomycetota bacterium]
MSPVSVFQNSDPEALACQLRQDLLDTLHPGDLICIPTGRSPLDLYRQIREDEASIRLWRSLRFLQLDEYIAPATHIDSFRDYLHQQIFDPLGVDKSRLHTIDPQGDPKTEAQRLDTVISEWGPPRACILGLGSNGHIAFNEPGSNFSSYTAIDLTPETISANFKESPPAQLKALTISLEQIYASRDVFLLVPQPEKKSILDHCLRGPKDLSVPGTILHDHPGLHIYRA